MTVNEEGEVRRPYLFCVATLKANAQLLNEEGLPFTDINEVDTAALGDDAELQHRHAEDSAFALSPCPEPLTESAQPSSPRLDIQTTLASLSSSPKQRRKRTNGSSSRSKTVTPTTSSNKDSFPLLLYHLPLHLKPQLLSRPFIPLRDHQVHLRSPLNPNVDPLPQPRKSPSTFLPKQRPPKPLHRPPHLLRPLAQ